MHLHTQKFRALLQLVLRLADLASPNVGSRFVPAFTAAMRKRTTGSVLGREGRR